MSSIYQNVDAAFGVASSMLLFASFIASTPMIDNPKIGWRCFFAGSACLVLAALFRTP